MAINEWLPKLEPYQCGKEWIEYSYYLYSIFEHDFIKTNPKLDKKKVQVRKYPMYNNKYEAYFHLTCKDYKIGTGERSPDLKRCERIRWPKAFINNFFDRDLLVWKMPYKSVFGIILMSKSKRHIVILEERNDYYLLITAFYYDHQHSYIKKLKEYDKNRDKFVI